MDHWIRDVASSTEFRRCYRSELAGVPKALRELMALGRQKRAPLADKSGGVTIQVSLPRCAVGHYRIKRMPSFRHKRARDAGERLLTTP